MNFGTREFGSIEYGGSSISRIVAINKSLKYTIPSTKEVSLGLKYTIDTVPTAIEKSLRYAVRVTTTIDKSLKYTVQITTVIEKSLKYTIYVVPTSIDKSLKYTIQTTQTIEKSLKYTIYTTTGIDKSLKYTVQVVTAPIEKALKYVVPDIKVIDKSLIYGVSLPVVTINKSLQYIIRTILIKINDVEIQDQVLLNSLSVENNLYNNADFARFEFIKSSVKTYDTTAGDEIAIYDSEEKIFGGILINMSRSMEGFAERYLLEFKDWNEELSNIIVSETYQNQTVNQIVADIDSTYLSGYDITNVSDATNIVRIDFDNISVSECLDKLATLSGKSWLVNFDKEIYLYTEGAISSPFDLTDSNEKYHYRSLKVETDYTQIRNKVSVQGKNIALVTVQDATSQSAYGVREYIKRDSNINSVSEATQLANSILAQFKDPAEKAEFITKMTGLYSGQEINITSTERSLNQDYNIEQVVFQSDHPHEFYYKIKCSTQRQYGLDDFVETTIQEPLETIPVSDQGYLNDISFSATNNEDITWSAGTIRLADGKTYSISSGGTTLTGDHIIYLDVAVSETVLQSSTSYADGMGNGKIPLAYASKSGVGTKNADIFPIGFGGKMQLDGSVHITDRSIIADQIAANVITANEIDVNDLFAQEITIANTGHIKGGQTAYDTGIGFFLGYSSTAYKFSLGNASGGKMTWDGTDFKVSGATITGGTIQTASADERIVISGSTNTLKIYDEDSVEVIDMGTFGANPILEITLTDRTHNGITIHGADDATSYGFEYLSAEDRASLALNIEMTSANAANNLSAISVINHGSGELFYGALNGTGKGISIFRASDKSGTDDLIKLQSSNNTAGASVFKIVQSGADVTSSCVDIGSSTKGKTLEVTNSNTSSSNPAGYFKGGATGECSLQVDKTVGGGALDVSITANDGYRCFGIEFNIANAGAGAEFAFHFQGSEVNMAATAVSTIDGVVKVYLPDGSAGYIPIYSSAS